MDFISSEPTAILSKCLFIISRAKTKLKQLDNWDFPTPSTNDGVLSLLEVLSWIEKPSNLKPIDSAVLFNRLYSIQKLVDVLCDSSSNRISWPLVSYCDEIWNRLFGSNGPNIFYSLTSEYNYRLMHFSNMLALNMDGLMPVDEIEAVCKKKHIYCLQLASSEDANLPLYANIGHEFGHAIFHQRHLDLLKHLDESLTEFVKLIYESLLKLDEAQAVRRATRIYHILNFISKELFCDLVGASLMGPAFYLSLYEMSWGQDKSYWPIILSPNIMQIRAYPSFHYRLACIYNKANIDEFCEKATRDFSILGSELCTYLTKCLQTVPRDDKLEKLYVKPDDDNDKSAIELVLNENIELLKNSLDVYLNKCDKSFKNWYPFVGSMPIRTEEIAQLLLRLKHDVVPNIIPDTTLLGESASFQGILNSSALYRIHLLTKDEDKEGDRIRNIGLVERLTSKSLEVSYIQKEFGKRRK